MKNDANVDIPFAQFIKVKPHVLIGFPYGNRSRFEEEEIEDSTFLRMF